MLLNSKRTYLTSQMSQANLYKNCLLSTLLFNMACIPGIKQFNIFKKTKRKRNQLKFFISCHDKDVDGILLKETCIAPSKTFKLPAYKIIRSDSERPLGDIAVVIKNKCSYKTLNTPNYHF